MATDQTAGEPPSRGSTIFAKNGCTEKSRNALTEQSDSRQWQNARPQPCLAQWPHCSLKCQTCLIPQFGMKPSVKVSIFGFARAAASCRLAAINRIRPRLKCLREPAERNVEHRAHHHAEHPALELIVDEEMHIAGVRSGRGEPPAIVQIFERAVDIFRLDDQRRAVEQHLAGEMSRGSACSQRSCRRRAAPCRPLLARLHRQGFRTWAQTADISPHPPPARTCFPRCGGRVLWFRNWEFSGPHGFFARRFQLGEIIARMMRGACERAGGDELEAFGMADGGEGLRTPPASRSG